MPRATKLTQAQRKEIQEMIAVAVQKVKDELADRDTEAIGFKYEPVSDFQE
jgi:hypothetical protein